MDHLVILEECWKEIEALVKGEKTMIIEGGDIREMQLKAISESDILYFAYNDSPDEIRARGMVTSVYATSCLTREESFDIIIRNQDKLMLPDDLFYTWAGKKFLILISLKDIETVESGKKKLYSFKIPSTTLRPPVPAAGRDLCL